MKWLIAVMIISLSLVSIWFNNGKILARAEEGIHFYNLQRTARIHSYLWQETQLGSINPFNFSRLPYFKFISVFEYLKIPNFVTELLVLAFLIFTSLISTFIFSRTVFPNQQNSTHYTAAIFYVFNLFTMSQVLQRFIWPNIFAWAYLPLFLYLWVCWIETSRVKYLLFFLLSSIIYSNSLGLTVFAFVLWIPAFVLWLRNRRIWPAGVAILLWMLLNFHWWYPMTFLKDTAYVQDLNISQNFISLVEVSKYFPSREIILLKQGYFFGPNSLWGNLYSRSYNLAIGFGLAGMMLIGVFRSLKARQGRVIVALLCVSWFLIKGANPPFGHQFYEWLFKVLPFTVLFRNPYEKLGIVFALAYSLLFAFGFNQIRQRLTKIIFIFIICFIYLRPYWTNEIFANHVIQVPDSYLAANTYLNFRSNVRLLHMPFLMGSGVSYTWGYEGEDPSNYLFDRASLSVTYFAPGDPYLEIAPHLASPNMYKLLQLFAIDTVVLHRDLALVQSHLQGVAESVELLKKWKHLNLTQSFYDLDIYELDRDLSPQVGFLANKVAIVPSLKDGIAMVVTEPTFNPLDNVFMTHDEDINIPFERLPTYTVNKLSTTLYQFDVTQAKYPFLLVLSNSYNDNWIAYINGQQLEKHLNVNGYANAWVVDKKGNFTVNVMFKTWPWE